MRLEHLTRPVGRSLDFVPMVLGAIEGFLLGPTHRGVGPRLLTGQGDRTRRHAEGWGGCESVVNDPSIPRYNVPTTVVSRSSPHRDSRAAQARLGDQAGEGFKKGKEKSFPES